MLRTSAHPTWTYKDPLLAKGPSLRTVTAADSSLEPPLLLLAAIIVSIRRCSSSDAALELLAKLAADEREDLNSHM